MQSYQLITDATADLPLQLVEACAIDVIPMEVIIQGEAVTFAPAGGSIACEGVCDALRAGKSVCTSQVNPAVYEACFEQYLHRGIDVLYVCFSSGLSGMVSAATSSMALLREKYPQRKLICVDSLCASAGEGFLVYAAAQMQQRGLPIDELANWLRLNRLRVCHWFTVADLKQLQSGGRLSVTAAMLGTLLNVKPVLHVDDDGCLINVAKARGRKKALFALAERLNTNWTPELGKTVFIAHADALEDAQYLQMLIQEEHLDAEISILPLGPVIGAHTGPGVIALFFWGASR